MICQLLKRHICDRGFIKSKTCLRHASTVAELTHRKLVKVSGPQSAKLLQGLFTNDINNLSETHGAMYTHLLNVRGRIMFDNIVYQQDTDTFLIEVDSSLVNNFIKFLSLYNIRSKAKISLTDERLYASFITGSSLLDGGYVDPRLPLLGCRHIGTPPEGATPASLSEYERHRVSLGVSEGTRDITSGKDFPFEHNLDFLNGVSFSKGCYIGQELTARTHHVGETRKRVVPVTLSDSLVIESFPVRLLAGTRGAGKLLSVYDNVGLAVIRLPFFDRELNVFGTDVTVVGSKPSWWPTDIR